MASPWFDDLSVQEEDDCDDDDDTVEAWQAPDLSVKLISGDKTGPFPCKVFLICFGPSACCLGASYLLGDDKDRQDLAQIVNSDDPKPVARLYNMSEDVIVCLSSKEVPPEASNIWTTKVLELVQGEMVLVLASFPAMRFLSSESLFDQMPLLRCIVTSRWPQDNLPCPFLEAPNTLIGCQAAILTHCELENKAAAVFLAVESRADVDIETLQLFTRALQSPALHSFFKSLVDLPDDKLTVALQQILPPPSVYSSMFS